MRVLLFAILLVPLVLMSGCTQTPAGTEGQSPEGVPESAFLACMQSCNNTKNAGDLMENGPCLLDPIPVEPDWVCDIAHSPRQPIDNSPNNQCQSYLQGQATHFIELTPECVLIRAV